MLPNKLLLTPGPWSVQGNTVKDGTGKTIAVVFARHAAAHAYWIAELPRLANQHGDASEVAYLRERLAAARETEKSLRQELSHAQARLSVFDE